MMSRLRIWWNTLNTRERRMIALGAVLSAVLIILLVDLEPVWKLRAKLAMEIPKLQEQLLEMRALSTEAAQLGKSLPATQPQELRQSLERSLKAAGLKAQRIESQTPGEWLVSMVGVNAADALRWMESASRESHLFIRTAKLVRTASGLDVEVRFLASGQAK